MDDGTHTVGSVGEYRRGRKRREVWTQREGTSIWALDETSLALNTFLANRTRIKREVSAFDIVHKLQKV